MIRLITLSLLLAITSIFTSCSSSINSQEFYEIRKYKIENATNQKAVLSYIDKAYTPALKRLGLSRIGVFKNIKDENDFSVYMVIPFASAYQYTQRSEKLFADSNYLESSKEFFSIPKKSPAYTRIESSFFKAFSGIPTMEIPEFIKVLSVSDIEASSDFKVKSPKRGIFKTKSSINFLPDLVE